MSTNNFLNISMISKETMMELKNEIVFAKGTHKDVSNEFAKKGAKIGSVFNIRKPIRFDAIEGAALQLQDVDDQSVPLTVDHRYHTAFQFSSEDLALSVDEFKDRYLKPGITPLANKIDQTGLLRAKNTVWNYTGTPGAQPADEAGALERALVAGSLLDDNGCPFDDERNLIVNPASEVAYVKYLSGLFNSQAALAKQYEKGRMGVALGAKWSKSQNVAIHTTGNVAGAPAVDTGSTADTLHIDGLTGNIAKVYSKGDVIEVDGVYAVNPVTKESTGRLMKFVVTADTGTSTSGEIAALPISPSIVTSGPYQNVTKAPADSDAVTLFGHATNYAGKSSPANILYHKNAFGLGMVKLPEPGGTDMAKSISDSGLSFRIVRDYDINNDIFPCRMDAMWGWKEIYPELASKIMG